MTSPRRFFSAILRSVAGLVDRSLDAATAGQTLVISAGSHTEGPVNINKSVTPLDANGKAAGANETVRLDIPNQFTFEIGYAVAPANAVPQVGWGVQWSDRQAAGVRHQNRQQFSGVAGTRQTLQHWYRLGGGRDLRNDGCNRHGRCSGLCEKRLNRSRWPVHGRHSGARRWFNARGWVDGAACERGQNQASQQHIKFHGKQP